MAYSEEELYPGEKIVLNLRPHWWFFAPQAAALVAAVILGVVALVGFPNSSAVALVTGVLILIVLGWFLVRYVAWSTTHLVLTTDRLISRSGVFTRQGIEIPLERINTVFYRETLFERLLGSGDLVVESAGENGNQSFANIRKPLKVQNEIYQQMESNENRKFQQVGQGPPVASGPSIPEQIGQLDQLRRQGIVSQAEFDAKKADLLKRM